MIDMKIAKKDQEILIGSSYLMRNNKVLLDRTAYMIENMDQNRAYVSDLKNNYSQSANKELLDKHKYKYKEYRRLWSEQPKECITKGLYGQDMFDQGYIPLCIDVETAAICDLACPFCYRQYVATPDKIMDKKLAFKLIDQASEMNVPSMKFNWRGEPLLNPDLPEIISHAKSKGILETIINTNVTELDEELSKKIISSGLDLMICFLARLAANMALMVNAYGGVYITASIFWMWVVERSMPDRWDIIGLLVCLIGAGIILFAPR